MVKNVRDNPADDYRTRKESHLHQEIQRPFPTTKCSSETADDPCQLGLLNLSAARFASTFDDPNTIKEANADLRTAINRLNIPGWEKDFHFVRAGILFRIVKLYGSRGKKSSGLLDADLEQTIVDVFARWAHSECFLEEAKRDNVWLFWGSENHGIQKDETCWAAALLLNDNIKYKGFTYKDGSSAAQQLAHWTAYQKRFIKSRVDAGVTIEFFSPTYTQYTLGPYYNYSDFSDDAELRKLATSFLNLWWAVWAQEQVGGEHGGSKARSYPKTIANGDVMGELVQSYFGLGKNPGISPGESFGFSSEYKPLKIIYDLATKPQIKGTYDFISKAPGIAREPVTSSMWYSVDPDADGVVRVTRSSPTFVMGLTMVPKLSSKKWVAPSSQNRWNGIVFGGAEDSRIVVQPAVNGPRHNYNSMWGVQHGSTQLVQRLSTPFGQDVGAMQVWFSPSLILAEDRGWVFVDGPAFVAIRPAYGGSFWDKDDKRRLLSNDNDAPIIIQAAERRVFSDLASFKRAVFSMPVETSDDYVRIKGLGDAGVITLYTKSDRRPEIDNRPFNFNPHNQFDSPFMKGLPGSGVVSLSFDGQRVDLDFR